MDDEGESSSTGVRSPWWAPRVVLALVRDGRSARDRAWILAYFISRLRVGGRAPLRALDPGPRALAFRSSPARLAVSIESGGLSAWYETSLRHVYAPNLDFEPQPGWAVIDIGANVGAYSAWVGGLIGKAGRLIAIEPNPVSFSQLTKSLASVPVHATALNLACGTEEGELRLYSEPGYTVSSSFVPFPSASRTDLVRVRPLDDVAVEQEVGLIDLLKIDVEGAEYLVLQGAKKTLERTERVILETTADEVGAAVSELLNEHGFEMVFREPDHWSISGLEIRAFRRMPNR
jgi:FkbM family methyltransferase